MASPKSLIDILNRVADWTNSRLNINIASVASAADLHAVSNWTATTTADNAAATVTKAAESGKSHYITGISGSYSVALIKLMTLKDGAAVIGNFYIHNQRDIVFAKPVKITAGNAAELSLSASGTAAQIGAVTMTGYTI